MADPAFFEEPVPVSLREIIELTGAEPVGNPDMDRLFGGVATLANAGPSDIAYVGGSRYLADAAATNAGLCFCQASHAAKVAPETICLTSANPQKALALVSRRLFPSAMRPLPVTTEAGVSPAAHVDPTARLEDNVVVEPGVVIGAGAEIGRDTHIQPNAVIGPGVRIGRAASIGAGATIRHALLGDRVIIHPGAHIGQDGFGFIPGATHLKVPQIGRVIIQDDVEIGAGTTIDRGAIRDTVIGEGTKIDNMVQIGHNVTIGRRCLIVSQVGISGSAVIEDFVVIGGQAGINGHITIGAGAQIAAVAAVYRDIPAGSKWGGSPARPYRDWLRAQSRDLSYMRSPRRANTKLDEPEGDDG